MIVANLISTCDFCLQAVKIRNDDHGSMNHVFIVSYNTKKLKLIIS